MKYEPGVLEAAAFDAGGRERGRNRLVSARGELHIQVKPEKETVKCGGIVYVDIALAGENKVAEMNADTALTVEVTGGALLGFGSAAPRTAEQFDAGIYTTYWGRAQAVIRAEKPGEITVTVRGKSLPEASAVIRCEKKEEPEG